MVVVPASCAERSSREQVERDRGFTAWHGRPVGCEKMFTARLTRQKPRKFQLSASICGGWGGEAWKIC